MERKNYIPHKILTINERIDVDPIFFHIFSSVFEWANGMGVEGKKVYSLLLEDCYTTGNPLMRHKELWCKIKRINDLDEGEKPSVQKPTIRTNKPATS